MEGILQPIIFFLSGVQLNLSPNGRRGVPPPMRGMLPMPATRLLISGVTKDSTGTPLPACQVSLYRTFDDVLLERVTSDGSGAYSFSAVGLSRTYYVVAYLAGSPDVAGTTRNDLVGV